jgi:hypothetical protein
MKYIIMAGVAVALGMSGSAPRAQMAKPAPQAASTSAEQPASSAESTPTDEGLRDLATMTFGCPKAALNAAAREAAKIRSQGTYQFAYFNIVSDSHHAAYEVHFKSNYAGEKDLKYCVALYCQQGWDPKTTQTAVTLMNDPHRLASESHACLMKSTKARSGPGSNRRLGK